MGEFFQCWGGEGLYSTSQNLKAIKEQTDKFNDMKKKCFLQNKPQKKQMMN